MNLTALIIIAIPAVLFGCYLRDVLRGEEVQIYCDTVQWDYTRNYDGLGDD